MQDSEATVTTILSLEMPINERNEHVMNRVAKLITIPAETETCVVVIESKCGLMMVKWIQSQHNGYSPHEVNKRPEQTSHFQYRRRIS